MPDKSAAIITVTMRKLVNLMPLLPVIVYSMRVAHKRGVMVGWVWRGQVRSKGKWF